MKIVKVHAYQLIEIVSLTETAQHKRLVAALRLVLFQVPPLQYREDLSPQKSPRRGEVRVPPEETINKSYKLYHKIMVRLHETY